MEKDNENILISRNLGEHATFSPHTCATWSYQGHHLILLEGRMNPREAVPASPATMPKGSTLAPWLHSWPVSDPLSCRPQLPGPCRECGGDCQGPICRRRMSHIPASSTLSRLLLIAPGPRSGVCLYIYEPGNCRFWHAIYLTI